MFCWYCCHACAAVNNINATVPYFSILALYYNTLMAILRLRQQRSIFPSDLNQNSLFRRVRKLAKSDDRLRHVRLCVLSIHVEQFGSH